MSRVFRLRKGAPGSCDAIGETFRSGIKGWLNRCSSSRHDISNGGVISATCLFGLILALIAICQDVVRLRHGAAITSSFTWHSKGATYSAPIWLSMAIAIVVAACTVWALIAIARLTDRD